MYETLLNFFSGIISESAFAIGEKIGICHKFAESDILPLHVSRDTCLKNE